LESALLEQSIVAHDVTVGAKLLPAVTLRRYEAGEVVLNQDGADTHICFILTGQVVVEIHGREMARRQGGQHIGEMALIDPSARRSATIRGGGDGCR
jgi:CRP/FNR family transcriptional regulator, cyclic AMP receptor protein